ncbi:hypothetical protein SAMN02745146_0566 [Hymenobacter daecheongensis DSM 21074]|uniref:Uncharacterized protein n=1 Tax=Hymenobacter daecheongensis DSM 21074 TaxID=1121955 RepID=A0A1M6AAI9_9BACT|nr:hypothetical protein [Hymenobacter daecheongensis]SHI33470.1 hypothetical protein SAMN02745146_0566 [Hymenobacter daecheongensis DSM 21074]
MNTKYRAADPAAEVNGRNIQIVLDALPVPQQATALLRKHGLPTQPEPDSWYSWQAWLDVLAELEEIHGAPTLYAAGLQCITHSLWPPNLHTMHEALLALDWAYHANVRGQELGYYRVEGRGLREVRVVCLTPNPVEFDRGIITGLVRKFKPMGAGHVRVEAEPTPAGSPPGLKWFAVSW